MVQPVWFDLAYLGKVRESKNSVIIMRKKDIYLFIELSVKYIANREVNSQAPQISFHRCTAQKNFSDVLNSKYRSCKPYCLRHTLVYGSESQIVSYNNLIIW